MPSPNLHRRPKDDFRISGFLFLKCHKSRIRDDIIFTGRRGDVESIMNICHVGILSTFTEGISNSIVEFMAGSSKFGDGKSTLDLYGANHYIYELKMNKTEIIW